MSTVPPARPHLSAMELQQVRWFLGGILTLISVWTVFYLDVPAWTLMGMTTVGVLAVLAKPELPAKIPRWVHRLAFPAIVFVFVADLWISGELLPALVRLDILLLFYRGITYRQRRDDLQIIVLGLFLVVVAGVLTVSLTFAGQILIFTVCALAFLLSITLTSDGASKDSAATLQPRSDLAAPAWAAKVDWPRLGARLRQTMDWRIAVFGSMLFVALVAVSALLFLAIPRFQLENSFFLERFISKKSKTGFTDSIRFGDVTEIQQDNSVALTVDVSDRSRIPASPYWRMLILDEYRDGGFRMSSQSRGTFSDERSRLSLDGLDGSARVRSGEPLVGTFYLEAGVSRYLPLLGPFANLKFQELQNHRWARSLGIVALRSEPATMTAYRVEGMDIGALLPDRDFADAMRARPTLVSSRPPMALSLALNSADGLVAKRVNREIIGDLAPAAAEFGQKVSAWLAQRHAYSLQPAIPAGAGDPLVRWLEGTGGGHCELFAGSLVVLARAAGIPARVVTGFHGGSWNGYSNNFTLRNSNAHAWCELFDVNAGAWIRVDPTPGASAAAGEETAAEAALDRRTDRSWAARLDSLRVFWYRRIVSFDQRSQVETLRSVKQATENRGRELRAALERIVAGLKDWIRGEWGVRRISTLMAVLTALIALPWMARSIRWSFVGSGRRARGPQSSGVRAQAGVWLKRISNLEASPVQPLVKDLQRLRFGSELGWPDAKRVFRDARVAVRDQRRQRRK